MRLGAGRGPHFMRHRGVGACADPDTPMDSGTAWCLDELSDQRSHGMTTTNDLSEKTTIVVGASRGLGRGIAVALAEAGAPVVAIARTGAALAELADGDGATDGRIRTETADATDRAAASELLARYDPDVLVIVAGATPHLAALQDQTWEAFSVNWHADVQIAFHWLGAALRKPLRAGSRVIVISSGAALQGSPLSGGYAGAKATERFITAYAQDEAKRAGLGITFTTVLPRLTPLTDLGRPAVRAYAERNGQSEADYLQRFGEPLTPEAAGAAVLDVLRSDPTDVAADYLLTGAGLRQVA